jgi:hypothetical protein
MRHESESPSVSTALQRANEEKRTHCTSATQYGGTVALNGHGTEFARVVSEYKLWVQIIQDSSLERCRENNEEERILECRGTTCHSDCHGAG